jgi:hypothetical protein
MRGRWSCDIQGEDKFARLDFRVFSRKKRPFRPFRLRVARRSLEMLVKPLNMNTLRKQIETVARQNPLLPILP